MNNLLAALFLLVAAHAASGLECYQCTSMTDPNCASPFSGAAVDTTACTLESHGVLKSHPKYRNLRQESPVCVSYTGSDENGSVYTVRTCSLFGADTCRKVEEAAALDGAVVTECSVCELPLCNDAPALASPALLAAALAIAVRTLFA